MNFVSIKVDTRGLDKAALLAALYNHAALLGAGTLQAHPGDMSVAHARAILDARADGVGPYPYFFDYLYGRLLKVDLGADEMCAGLYDRDWGEGKVAEIVARLRTG